MALLDIETRFQHLNLESSSLFGSHRDERLKVANIFNESAEFSNKIERENDVEGKVFIGGISWQTTPEMLRQHFGAFGTITDVSLMKDKYTGLPRGFGFIKFENPISVDMVLAQTEHFVDGRCVDVKRAVSKSEAPGPGKTSKFLEGHKVFVGGLAPSVSVVDFRLYFENFGIVLDAIVMYDRQTQRSRGFGFITFRDEYIVQSVLMRPHEIHGKIVDVKHAEPRDSRKHLSSPGIRDIPAGYSLPLSSPFGSVHNIYSPRSAFLDSTSRVKANSLMNHHLNKEYERLLREREHLEYLMRKSEYESRRSAPSTKSSTSFNAGKAYFPQGDLELYDSEGGLYLRGNGEYSNVSGLYSSGSSDQLDYLSQF